ncbi:hypothetical protein [Bacillus sp. UNC41MFS5]|uniref:hypothetical protein n=1 Tax=Bacillus sp. UNC41MFS5 TaxID=1449046 RepID=UPI000479FF99|nr:hypothetical protein [Bacillus sp. UNC41MFS5]
MLKSGIYGKYRGTEYEITGDMDNNVKIITEEKGKIDSTFEDLYNTGVYSKIVDPSELVDCVSIALYGIIQGEKVQILQEKGNEYQVAAVSSLIGNDLNLPRVDRDTWLGWVPKSKVKLMEEKTAINPGDL